MCIALSVDVALACVVDIRYIGTVQFSCSTRPTSAWVRVHFNNLCCILRTITLHAFFKNNMKLKCFCWLRKIGCKHSVSVKYKSLYDEKGITQASFYPCQIWWGFLIGFEISSLKFAIKGGSHKQILCQGAQALFTEQSFFKTLFILIWSHAWKRLRCRR